MKPKTLNDKAQLKQFYIYVSNLNFQVNLKNGLNFIVFECKIKQFTDQFNDFGSRSI